MVMAQPKGCTLNFLLCQKHITYLPSWIESKKMDMIHGLTGLILMVVIKCQTGKKIKPHNLLLGILKLVVDGYLELWGHLQILPGYTVPNSLQ